MHNCSPCHTHPADWHHCLCTHSVQSHGMSASINLLCCCCPADCTMLMQPESLVGKRAYFARKHLFVTPHHDDQLFPAGDHVVQSEECLGLAQWTKEVRHGYCCCCYTCSSCVSCCSAGLLACDNRRLGISMCKLCNSLSSAMLLIAVCVCSTCRTSPL